MGLFNAELKAVIEGQSISRATYCRLGGSLDPKVWPAKQIIDIEADNLKFSPDRSRVAFASPTLTTIPNLYASAVDGSGLTQIGANSLQVGIDGARGNFVFSPDSSTILYTADSDLPNVFELFKSSSTGGAPIGLRTGMTDTNASVVGNFLVNQNYVVFEESGGQFVKSISLIDGSTHLLSSGTGYVHENMLLTDTKVTYLYQSGATPYLYTANLDGSNIQDITPSIPSGWQIDDVNPNLRLFAGGKYANVLAETVGNSREIVVAVDGSGSFALPDGAPIISIEGNYLLFNPDSVFSNFGFGFSVRYLTTGFVFNTPALPMGTLNFLSATPHSVFLSGNNIILPAVTDASYEAHVQSLALDGSSVQELCPGVSSKLMNITSLDSNSYLVTTFDQDVEILNVYMLANNSCRKVNSAVVTSSLVTSIASVTVSPDKQKMLVKLGRSTVNYAVDSNDGVMKNLTDSDQVYYIPLAGGPPCLVNAPTSPSAQVPHVEFTNDSKFVVYQGDQIVPSENNIFLWQIP